MTLAPRDITNEFSKVFDSRGGVQSVKMMSGDASSRRYLRVTSGNDSSFVLQIAQPFDKTNSFSCGQQIFSRAGIRVPAIVDSIPSLGWILLEDLGDESYQGKLTAETINKVLHPLVLLMSFDVEASKKALPDAPHWSWAFDYEKLNFEILFFKEHFLNKLLGAESKNWKAIEDCCKLLADSKRILCHRDYHSRNIMSFNGECCVIDFQDARFGPASYDWVSILWDPYSPMESSLKESSRELFHKLHKQQLGVDRCDSEIEFWSCMLQRMLKAVGSYASFKNINARNEYLQYIVPALENGLIALTRLTELVPSKESSAFKEELCEWIQKTKNEVLNF